MRLIAGLAGYVTLVALCATSVPAMAEDGSLRNQQLVVTINPQDGSYALTSALDGRTILRSVVAAQINHRWAKSSEYPKHEVSKAWFEDRLGRAQQIVMRSTGLPQSPDLICILRQYEQFSFIDIEVEVQNHTSKAITVQGIRSVESIGNQPLDLGAPERYDRVMSDAEFSPPILALGNVPDDLHIGIESQLIYNTESKQSVFVGALTEERFVTMIRLKTQGSASDRHISGLTIESTGTTELFRSMEGSLLERLPAAEQYDVNLNVAPGSSLASERLMASVANDYYAQLDTYGAVVRQLHQARLSAKTMMGWLADVIYTEGGIPEGLARTNANWLTKHLKSFGFNYVHVDANAFVPTADATSDRSQSPHGMWGFAQEISELGLRKAGWVNILDVPDSSFIYKEHRDWLVKNAQEVPLSLLRNDPVHRGRKMHFGFLDTTHPGAQAYLRRIFRTMAREWGWRQIDLDGITDWSIEGYRYRPNTTAIEADRIALQIIRETVGEDVVLHLNAGFLELSSVGLVDVALIADPSHAFSSTKQAGYRVPEHYYMDHNFFVNDPGPVCVQSELTSTAAEENGRPEPVSLEHAQMSIVLSALSPGARFGLGDDLPNLGTEPERLALVTNPDLLQMVKLGRSARPLDLMSYHPQDEQPSIFFLREDARQSMLAVFNWTKQTRSHTLQLADLGLANGHSYNVYDVFNQSRPLMLENDAIHLDNQAAESVILVKILDEAVAPAAPTITAEAPHQAKVLEDVKLSAQTSEDSVPALTYKWDFGDGVTAEGPIQNHTYTKTGSYTVQLKVDGVDDIAAEKNLQITVDGAMEIAPPHSADVYAD